MYGLASINRGTQADNCWRVAFYKKGRKWIQAAIVDGGGWRLVKLPINDTLKPAQNAGPANKEARKVIRRMKRNQFSKGAWTLINEVAKS